jgi:hypothetical protein
MPIITVKLKVPKGYRKAVKQSIKEHIQRLNERPFAALANRVKPVSRVQIK